MKRVLMIMLLSLACTHAATAQYSLGKNITLMNADGDSVNVSLQDYDYILIFDRYVCTHCISNKIKKHKKVLLIPLDNDDTRNTRIYTQQELKFIYPRSQAYFTRNAKQKILLKQLAPINCPIRRR